MQNIDQIKLTKSARRLYAFLDYKFLYWQEKQKAKFPGNFYISTDDLIKALDMSRRCVQRSRQLLRDKKLIEYHSEYGRGKSITYSITKRFRPKINEQIEFNETEKKLDPDRVRDSVRLLGREKGVNSWLARGYKKTEILECL